MRSFKLDISKEEAENILTGIYDKAVSNVSPIEMGELSRVFSFKQQNKEYVVHFKNDRDSFDKGKFLYERYLSKLIPIPKVVKIGKVKDFYYSISEKAIGQPISEYVNDTSIDDILDHLMKCLAQINQVNISSKNKFGLISPKGQVNDQNWLETLAVFFDENQEGFHKNWTNLYEESFLEKTVFSEAYEEMMTLAKYSPSKPYLVHGDFHLGNMISDGSQVTGIVDWEIAMFGDFMFDVAVLHFWAPELKFPERVLKFWAENGEDIPSFEERLRCHLLFKAIDGLRFYAKKNDLNSYNVMKSKISDILTI